MAAMSRPRAPLGVSSLVMLAIGAACARGQPDRSSTDASGTTSSAPRPTDDVPDASMPPDAAPSAALPPSWLGVAVDPTVRLERVLRITSQRDPGYAAELQVPAGWNVVNLKNGQYDETLAHMAIAPDKTALAILFVFEPGVWHESLVQRAAEVWLSISGGVSPIDGWDPPTPTGIGPSRTSGTRVVGRGTLGRAPAELWQIRRRFPSTETGKYALVVTGAVQRSAPPRRRAEFLACLATFVPTRAK